MSLWQDVEVVEVSVNTASISTSESDLSLVTLHFGKLGIEQNLDSSLVALLEDVFVGFLIELGESVVGIHNCERRKGAEFSDLSVVFPVVPSLEEVVGSDLTLERVLWNVEISITVVVVSDPTSLLGVACSPFSAVEGSIDGAHVVIPSFLEALDIVVIFLHSQSKNELFVLDLCAVLELDGVPFRENLNYTHSVRGGNVVGHRQLGRDVVFRVSDLLALIEWSDELLQVVLAIVSDVSSMVA